LQDVEPHGGFHVIKIYDLKGGWIISREMYLYGKMTYFANLIGSTTMVIEFVNGILP
jgi:hypothetical protein